MTISLETIDYQYKDPFPKLLESVIDDIYDALSSHGYKDTEEIVKKHPSAKKIDGLIKDRFNLNIELQSKLHVISPAAIIPFSGDYYRHGMKKQGFTDFFNFNGLSLVETINTILKDKKAMLSKIHNKKGFINTKLARVGGYLSEVRHYLIIDFKWMMESGINSAELTAIILHEIGHAFDGLEEHYRLETTNRAILDILVDLNDNKTEEAQYKFKNTFTESEFKHSHLDNDTLRQDFCGELAKQYVGHAKSQLHSGKYDENNFENMADSFAARFGMGKHLVSGLDKLMRSHGAVLNNTLPTKMVYYTVDVLLIAVLFLIVPVYGALVWVLVMSYLCNTANSSYTYDRPLDRYQRIRNTIVNSLKKLDLPKEVVKDLLEQVEYIDTTIANSVALRSSYSIAGDVIFSDARRDTYYVDLQRMIEDRLNNNLFVKSAQIRAS